MIREEQPENKVYKFKEFLYPIEKKKVERRKFY
jgi:hypothetical protein